MLVVPPCSPATCHGTVHGPWPGVAFGQHALTCTVETAQDTGVAATICCIGIVSITVDTLGTLGCVPAAHLPVWYPGIGCGFGVVGETAHNAVADLDLAVQDTQ